MIFNQQEARNTN